MRAERPVFGHQVVEARVGSFCEADDGEVFMQSRNNLAGLIGKGVELFGGEVETLVMAIADKIGDGENGDNRDGQDGSVSALLRGTLGEKSDDALRSQPRSRRARRLLRQ